MEMHIYLQRKGVWIELRAYLYIVLSITLHVERIVIYFIAFHVLTLFIVNILCSLRKAAYSLCYVIVQYLYKRKWGY